MSAIMTIWGFEDYLNNKNDDLWKYLSIPDDLDKDTLTDTIKLRAGEFCVLYSNPYFMQDAIKVWSTKWARTFNKWVEALNIDYDPLNNYDRIEEWTESSSGTDSRENSGTTSGTTENSTTGTNDTTINNKISAYNSSTLQNDTQSVTDNDTTLSDSGSSSGTSTNNESGEHAEELTRTGHLYGNIGVTTSQQMLQSELEIARFNLYDQIADLFCMEFVVPIY